MGVFRLILPAQFNNQGESFPYKQAFWQGAGKKENCADFGR